MTHTSCTMHTLPMHVRFSLSRSSFSYGCSVPCQSFDLSPPFLAHAPPRLLFSCTAARSADDRVTAALERRQAAHDNLVAETIARETGVAVRKAAAISDVVSSSARYAEDRVSAARQRRQLAHAALAQTTFDREVRDRLALPAAAGDGVSCRSGLARDGSV